MQWPPPHAPWLGRCRRASRWAVRCHGTPRGRRTAVPARLRSRCAWRDRGTPLGRAQFAALVVADQHLTLLAVPVGLVASGLQLLVAHRLGTQAVDFLALSLQGVVAGAEL